MTSRSFLVAVSVSCVAAACELQEKTYCIAEGTRVETPSGSLAVELLRVGDLVWSVDPITGERVEAPIVAIREAWARCLELRAGGESLLASASHPVFDVTSGRYVPLGEWQHLPNAEILRVGDRDESGAAVKDVDAPGSASIPNSEWGVLAAGTKVSGYFDRGSIVRPAMVERTGRVLRVFDLTVDSPYRNFVANGFLVHNKAPLLQFPYAVEDLRMVSIADTFAEVAWTVPDGEDGPATFFFIEFDSAPNPSPKDPAMFRLEPSNPMVGDSLQLVRFPLRRMQTYTVRIHSSYYDNDLLGERSDTVAFVTTAPLIRRGPTRPESGSDH